jgi:hypothetical protein
VILRSEFPLKLEEFHAMANPSIDPAVETAHGAAFQLEPAADLGQRSAVGQQLLYCGVAFAGAYDQGPFAAAHVERPVRFGSCRLRVRGGFGVAGGLRSGVGNRAGGRVGFGGHRGPDAGVMRGDGLVDGFAHVVPDMPSVRDLDGIRCTRAGAVAVGTRPVPADDVCSGMFP